MGRRISTLCLCAIAALAVRADAATLPGRIVDTEWLDAHVEEVVVVDIRDAITAYWESHIPGAVYLNAEAMRLAEGGTPVMLAPAEMIADKLGALGIAADTPVVIYTETGDYKAPYLLWILDYLGHEASAVMEGGFGKWQAEGRFVTQQYPDIEACEYELPATLDNGVRCSTEDVEDMVASGDYAMIDVRNPALYTGERGFWKRNGHVPGFKGHFWGDDLNADGTWKDVDALREAYAKLGVVDDRPVVVMCGQGLMSAQAYFTLKYILGVPDVTNYDGGFHEWSHDDLPVATGAE